VGEETPGENTGFGEFPKTRGGKGEGKSKDGGEGTRAGEVEGGGKTRKKKGICTEEREANARDPKKKKIRKGERGKEPAIGLFIKRRLHGAERGNDALGAGKGGKGIERSTGNREKGKEKKVVRFTPLWSCQEEKLGKKESLFGGILAALPKGKG